MRTHPWQGGWCSHSRNLNRLRVFCFSPPFYKSLSFSQSACSSDLKSPLSTMKLLLTGLLVCLGEETLWADFNRKWSLGSINIEFSVSKISFTASGCSVPANGDGMLKWCVTSNAELNKCETIKSHDPTFSCVQRSSVLHCIQAIKVRNLPVAWTLTMVCNYLCIHRSVILRCNLTNSVIIMLPYTIGIKKQISTLKSTFFFYF